MLFIVMAGEAAFFYRIFEEVDLISRHIDMLKVTKEMQPIGIIRLSEVLGIPKHKVRYSHTVADRRRI
jgi:predicted transcriptional regulator